MPWGVESGGVATAALLALASCARVPGTPEPVGDPALASGSSSGPDASAPAAADRAFCESAGRGWFDLAQMPDGGCYPYEACGDGGFRVPATSINVQALIDGGPGTTLGSDNVVIRLFADGNWPSHYTVKQQMACTARYCGGGRIVVESRYCFSQLPIDPSKGVIHLQPGDVMAGCSPGHLPEGHYTATVDGISVEFDIPQVLRDGERVEYTRPELLCVPKASRDAGALDAQ